MGNVNSRKISTDRRCSGSSIHEAYFSTSQPPLNSLMTSVSVNEARLGERKLIPESKYAKSSEEGRGKPTASNDPMPVPVVEVRRRSSKQTSLDNKEEENCASELTGKRANEELQINEGLEFESNIKSDPETYSKEEGSSKYLAELVGLHFDAEEKQEVKMPQVTRECMSKEGVQKYDKVGEEGDGRGPEENPDFNELQAYYEYIEIEWDENDATPETKTNSNLKGPSGRKSRFSVKKFSPREVHNGTIIGEGGFGRVLKGSLSSGTPVAIKLFHAPLAITREVKELLSLKHKNVVAVLGVVHQVEELDCPQLVLQYIEEGNILQYLSRHENPDDNNTFGKIALDVTEGCKFLHEHGIVHGNLAARNILIERVVAKNKTYYNAKISDVGLIRFAEVSGGNYMKIPGTERVVPMRWVPKEIVEEQEDGSVGTDFTYASDVWSFGVALWEIWTRGAIPYGASYSNLRVMQFLKDGYSPLKVHRPTECPKTVVAVMKSIFRVLPNERPSFDQLHERFIKFKGHGKEYKNKASSSGEASQNPLKEKETRPLAPMIPSEFGDDDDEKITHERMVNSRGDNVKVGSPTKKKNKGKKAKMPVEEKNGTSTRTSVVNTEVEGASALSTQSKSLEPNQETELTVAALLERVNLLEKAAKEKRAVENVANGGGGRGTMQNWPKRSWGPTRSNRGGRGGYSGRGYKMIGRSSSIQDISAAPPTPPPPYTEDPLPHHSSSRFSAPLPEYDYGHSSGPAIIRSSAAPRGYPGNSGAHRNQTAALDRALSRSEAGGDEDFIRKIKRLGDEIEFLRAEKMTGVA